MLPQVLPSSVRKRLEEQFREYLTADKTAIISRARAAPIEAIIGMMEMIPTECWAGVDYGAFIEAKSAVESTMRAWDAGRGIGGLAPAGGENVPRLLHSLLSQMSDDPPKLPQKSPGAAVNYISQHRIEELRKIPKGQFDLAKLIRLCEELNSNWHGENWLSVGFLVRAIVDHVPPIFGHQSFKQYVAVCGGKSLKASLTNLEDSSRNISDRLLHEQVARRVSLPTDTQVWFAPELDVLLGEIATLLAP